jgi:hypothetical protein
MSITLLNYEDSYNAWLEHNPNHYPRAFQELELALSQGQRFCSHCLFLVPSPHPCGPLTVTPLPETDDSAPSSPNSTVLSLSPTPSPPPSPGVTHDLNFPPYLGIDNIAVALLISAPPPSPLIDPEHPTLEEHVSLHNEALWSAAELTTIWFAQYTYDLFLAQHILERFHRPSSAYLLFCSSHSFKRRVLVDTHSDVILRRLSPHHSPLNWARGFNLYYGSSAHFRLVVADYLSSRETHPRDFSFVSHPAPKNI